jgi:EAL domain-containing protein (putative c-di-GMP-specific phosphodiesterase class I)
MVIAEGVERAEEFETVKSLGVHLVQGFFLHKPSQAPFRASNPHISAIPSGQLAQNPRVSSQSIA